jgi:hypothetical protein
MNSVEDRLKALAINLEYDAEIQAILKFSAEEKERLAGGGCREALLYCQQREIQRMKVILEELQKESKSYQEDAERWKRLADKLQSIIPSTPMIEQQKKLEEHYRTEAERMREMLERSKKGSYFDGLPAK